MNISLHLDRSIRILQLEGRLDARGAAVLDEQLTALPANTSHLVMDMTKVDYLSSIGIRSLFSAEKTLRARSGAVFLVGVTPAVSRILEIVGLQREFRHFPDQAAAVEAALQLETALAGAREYTVRGRTYREQPVSSTPCTLELWGTGADLSVAASPIDVSLEELGFAFGVGALGSHAVNSLGEFVALGNLVGVIPADGHYVSDFVVSDRPADVALSIAGAIGLSGPPTRVVEVSSPTPFVLSDMLQDLVAEQKGTVGFVMKARAAEVKGSCYADQEALKWGETSSVEVQKGAELWLVGAFSGHFSPPHWHAHGVILDTSSRTPKLDDLKGVLHVAPETTVSGGSISLYIPSSVRPGIEKRLKIEADTPLEDDWYEIIRRLYSDCSRVILTQLTGGYMAKTFRVASYDSDGRRLLPTVLKITTRELIQREEEAHRTCVQRFILNNSTTIMGTASAGDWAALRYNFLGVAGAEGKLNWLRDHFQSRPTPEVIALFDRLYTRILKPWYGQPRWEPAHLYADHTPLRLFPNLCAEAERQFGFSTEQETIPCPELGGTLPNPFHFLKYEYPKRALQSRLWYQGINHGDLNPRNVLIDEHDNLYVIDFSETHIRNIVSDFARMETVIKFEFARLETDGDLARLTEFEQGLAEAGSLEAAAPNRYRGDDPGMEKIHAAISRLRRYANTVTLFETDIVPYWLALLEWTFSVVCYDLPLSRKKLAVYSAAILCKRIQELESGASG